MFKSAILKLTGMYLAILVIICLFFSANWYSIASRELDQSTRRQDEWLQVNPRALGPNLQREFLRVRDEQVLRSKQAVVFRIFLSNLGLVMIGALGSYYLARRTLRPIEEAHEAQVRFTADASHEMRTPLAAIKTETEVTLRDPKLTKQEAVQQLENNLDEVTRLQSLTESLLLLARDQADEPSELTITNLIDIVDHATHRISKSLPPDTVKFDVKLELKHITANKEILETILGIILDNAAKYSPKGSTVTITFKASNKKHGVLAVSDHGVGIPKDQLNRIFERFYRADQSRTKQIIEGHGLGLAIAQDLANRMGTNINVASVEGVGSTFSIALER